MAVRGNTAEESPRLFQQAVKAAGPTGAGILGNLAARGYHLLSHGESTSLKSGETSSGKGV
jgi:hypothetical protein